MPHRKLLKKQPDRMRFFDGRYFDLDKFYYHHVLRPWDVLNIILASAITFVVFGGYLLLKR